MELDPSKKAAEPESEKTQSAEEKARPVTGDDNVQPIVLPIVLVPVEETSGSDIAARAADADDLPLREGAQPITQGAAPIEASPGANPLPLDAFLDLPPKQPSAREFQLPLPSEAEGAPLPQDAGLSLKSAIERFTSLAADGAPQSISREQPSIAHPIGRHVGSTAGDIVRGIYRREDDQGAPGAIQLGSPSGSGEEPGRVDRSAGSPPGPATHSPLAPGDDPVGRVPQLNVFVQMAGARAMYDEAMDEAAKRLAPDYRQIAAEEVKHAFWEFNCERRAADYRLRGPSW